MLATKALEEDKFAQCRQLLTRQATAVATGASGGAAGSGAVGAWTAADDARLTRYNASQRWVVPIESKVVKRAHTAPCSDCGTTNGFAINMNYFTARRTESESFTKYCEVCMLVLFCSEPPDVPPPQHLVRCVRLLFMSLQSHLPLSFSYWQL